MHDLKHNSQIQLLFVCLSLIPLMCLGMDLYVPSLPAMQRYFHVTPHAVQLTIVLYTFGFALAQPFVGMIADRIEQKSFILAALILYCLSAIACAFSTDIQYLYVFSFFSSVCAACTSNAVRILISENFEGKMLAKANNYYVMGWSITPIVAPAIGGYLQHYFDWQANFYFIALYSVFSIMCVMFFLPAKIKYHEHTLSVWQKTRQTWKILLNDKPFLYGIFILSVENAILFLYYAATPFIIQNTLYYNAAEYGKIVLFGGVSFLLGSLLNGKLINYFSIEKLMSVGVFGALLLSVITIILILLLHSNVHPTLAITIIPIFLIFMLDGFVFANTVSKIMASYKNIAGTVNGFMIGGLNLLATAIVFVGSHYFNLHHLLTLNIIYCVLLLLAMLFYCFLCKYSTTH